MSQTVKFPYWGVLNYADSLWIKISPIFYIANPKPNPSQTTHNTNWINFVSYELVNSVH